MTDSHKIQIVKCDELRANYSVCRIDANIYWVKYYKYNYQTIKILRGKIKKKDWAGEGMMNGPVGI